VVPLNLLELQLRPGLGILLQRLERLVPSFLVVRDEHRARRAVRQRDDVPVDVLERIKPSPSRTLGLLVITLR